MAHKFRATDANIFNTSSLSDHVDCSMFQAVSIAIASVVNKQTQNICPKRGWATACKSQAWKSASVWFQELGNN